LAAAFAAALAGAACTELTGDFDRVIAVDIIGSLRDTVEEGDTLRLEAQAIDANGEVVPDAPIVWQSVDTGAVGFTIEETTGLVTGTGPGQGQVIARVENLPSDPVTITGTAAADSIEPASAQLDTVPASEAQSEQLIVVVYYWGLTSDSPPVDTLLALAGTAVHYDLVEPLPGSSAADAVFLAQTDTVPGSEPHHLVDETSAVGTTFAVLRKVSGATPPDSAIVNAVALRATRDTVAGSPVRFVVVFSP
jgi:hypothetical protein